MGSKVRVLFVIAGLPAGGAERQLALLLRELDRAGFEPGLLIFNAAEKVHYRNVFDQPLWFRALGLRGDNAARLIWPLLSGIRSAVRDFAPDVVYATLNVANHTVRLSKLFFRWPAPVVTSVRASYRYGHRWHEKLAERSLCPLSAMIVCNAPTTRDEMIADIGLDHGRLALIRNGIDPMFFAPAAAPQPTWWPNGRVALTIGRFSAEKNHLALVQAVAALDRSEGLGDWHFVFVGEGPLETAVRCAIASAGLEARVLLHRPVADPRTLYHAAQLLILPSLRDAMPNVVLEAQAAACPVAISVSANGAGAVSAADGFVLEGDLAQSLQEVLRTPVDKLKVRGQAARNRMLEEFSSQEMVHRTEQLLRQVAAAAAEMRRRALGEEALS